MTTLRCRAARLYSTLALDNLQAKELEVSEVARCKQRTFIALLLIFVVTGAQALAGLGLLAPLQDGAEWALGVATGFLLFSTAYHLALRQNARIARPLRALSILADPAVAVLSAALAPNELSFLFPFFLFCSLGIGLRYGIELMNVSLAVALCGFAATVLFSPYWLQHLQMTAGIMLMLTLLPWYFLGVLRKNAEATAVLRDLAMTDTLTGLGNRRRLMEQLVSYRARASRATTSQLGVLFFDLDGFKAVNDMRGHQAGDELLIAIANALKRATRKGDFIARVGGDEFVMLAASVASPEAVCSLADKVREAVKEAALVAAPGLGVSTSIGVALYPDCGVETSEDALLSMADKAMYAAKAAGKNCVSVAKV